MTTPVNSQPANAQDLLQQLLAILQKATVAATIVAPLTGPIAGDVAAGANLALALESIAQKAAAAYQAHTGQPLDLAALHHIEPIPDAPDTPQVG